VVPCPERGEPWFPHDTRRSRWCLTIWCHYLSQIRKEDIQMKITRKSLIVVAVV